MSRFDACLAFVLKMEGGFVNDPAITMTANAITCPVALHNLGVLVL